MTATPAVLAPIKEEIKRMEAELALLKKVQALLEPGAAPVVKRRRKLKKAVPTAEINVKVLAKMAENGQIDFSIPELEKLLGLDKNQISRSIGQLTASGAVLEVGIRGGVPGRSPRTYALAQQ